MDDKIVAFVDILGFKHFASLHYNLALELINNYLANLEALVLDQKMHPPSSYPNSQLQSLSLTSSLSGFEYLLPFSDSIVLIGNDPELFVTQLSHFLVSCYRYTSNHFTGSYQPDNKIEDETEVISIDFPHKDKIHLHPVLFRGSIAYGKIDVAKVGSIKEFPLLLLWTRLHK